MRKGSVTDLLIVLLKRKVKRNASQLAFLSFLHCCTINLIFRLLYYSHELCAFLGSPPDNSDEIAHEIWPTSFAVYKAETCNAVYTRVYCGKCTTTASHCIGLCTKMVDGRKDGWVSADLNIMRPNDNKATLARISMDCCALLTVEQVKMQISSFSHCRLLYVTRCTSTMDVELNSGRIITRRGGGINI